MAYSVTFAGLTAPVMTQLDTVFNQVGNLGVIPCAVTGTNALTMTPTAGRTPPISAYFDNMQVAGIVVTTNTTALTARVGALAALNVYKDSPSGPVVCSGGELIAQCAFTLRYDAALNTGAGGWHLYANTGYAGGTISGAVYINNNLTVASLASISGSMNVAGPAAFADSLSVGSLASITQLMVGASASSISRILSASGTLAFTVIPANTTQQRTLAVPGAAVNDVVSVGPPASVTTGTHFMGYVLAAGTVAVVGVNPTAASLVPVAGIYRVAVTGFT